MSRHETNLTFEALEPKILLAGNVVVKETGSGLKIKGDIESNVITIARVDSDTVRISGNTVNGSAAPQDFDLGKGNVKLNFKQGGNDTVNLTNTAGVDLELNSFKGKFGGGNDTFTSQSSNTAGALDLKMGDGDNLVNAANSSFRGDVKIRTGDDSGDQVILNSIEVEVLGKTSIKTGAGNDDVVVSGFGATGSIAELVVELEEGTDTFLANNNRIVGLALLDGGDGADSSNGTVNTFAPGNPIVLNVENRQNQW